MRPRWAVDPGENEPLVVPPEERGAVLVELLGLTDALPPAPEQELQFPPFRSFLGSMQPAGATEPHEQ